MLYMSVNITRDYKEYLHIAVKYSISRGAKVAHNVRKYDNRLQNTKISIKISIKMVTNIYLKLMQLNCTNYNQANTKYKTSLHQTPNQVHLHK